MKYLPIAQIPKLYLSNFLTGLVFWYGIEKLFMTSIGIDAVGVGVVSALLLGFNLIFDIPSGILADRWSRKGMLVVSTIALAASSIICGLSDGLLMYVVGVILYGIYVVSTSGTYQAIIYDSLHEENRAHDYSRINGRAYALFLAGTGVGNLASGFIAAHGDYRLTFFITVISCALNALLILTLHEPTFHKAEKKERLLSQLHTVSKTILSTTLLRTLAIVMSALAIVELFKIDFGQLYMMRYVSQPEILGILWAVDSFTWAFGSLIAHRLRARLTSLIVISVIPLIIMSFVDSAFSIALLMLQAVAAAALFNQIETRVQENTPSSVRASVLSVLSAVGRGISIPASFVLGWLFKDFNELYALRFVTIVACGVLLYWFIARKTATKPLDIA